MKSIWTSYFLPADTDHDGSVTVDELIVHMRSVGLMKEYAFNQNIATIIKFIIFNKNFRP